MKHLLKIVCLVVFMLIFVNSAFAGMEVLQSPPIFASTGQTVGCFLRNVHEDEQIDATAKLYNFAGELGTAGNPNLEPGKTIGIWGTSTFDDVYYCDFEVTRDMDRHILTTICSSFGCVSGFNIK
jgi:hypothetical protein